MAFGGSSLVETFVSGTLATSGYISALPLALGSVGISFALLSTVAFVEPHKSNLCLGWSGLRKLTFTILTWTFGKGFWSMPMITFFGNFKIFRSIKSFGRLSDNPPWANFANSCSGRLTVHLALASLNCPKYSWTDSLGFWLILAKLVIETFGSDR
ncbi:unnamed protein product [Prunus brigantina]